jgi:hypothetical protein
MIINGFVQDVFVQLAHGIRGEATKLLASNWKEASDDQKDARCCWRFAI